MNLTQSHTHKLRKTKQRRIQKAKKVNKSKVNETTTKCHSKQLKQNS